MWGMAHVDLLIKIEICSDFNYLLTMETGPTRRAARRIRDVPPAILAQLVAGEIETVNLMEWLATDMAMLAHNIAAATSSRRLNKALKTAAERMRDCGITRRLLIAGGLVSIAAPDLRSRAFPAEQGVSLPRLPSKRRSAPVGLLRSKRS